MNQLRILSKISYIVHGKGQPIVFLHGLGLDSHSTELLFEPILRDSDFQRIYLDLPGMGKSASDVFPSSNNILRLLIEVIRKIVGSQQFILYGHSFGGYLAQGIALNLKEQVAGMFLTAPVITANSSKRRVGEHVNISQTNLNPVSNSEYFEDFLSMGVMINQQSWELYQKLIIPGLTHADQSFLSRLAGEYSLSIEQKLKNATYEFSLEILVGKNDQVVGYQEQAIIGLKNANCGFVLLNKAGHNLMIDQLELVCLHFKVFELGHKSRP